MSFIPLVKNTDDTSWCLMDLLLCTPPRNDGYVFAWRRSVSRWPPLHLPGVHPYHCSLFLSLLVSIQTLSWWGSTLHWSATTTTTTNTTTPTHLQAQVGVNICSWRRPGSWQMDDNTAAESSSLQPGILEGKRDKRWGGDEDGRLERECEGVKERKEEEEEVYRVKWHILTGIWVYVKKKKGTTDQYSETSETRFIKDEDDESESRWNCCSLMESFKF